MRLVRKPRPVSKLLAGTSLFSELFHHDLDLVRYSTSKKFDQRTALTHNFFWGECSGDVSPVLLTVDPSTIGLDLQVATYSSISLDDRLTPKCFVNAATLTVGDKALIASFTPGIFGFLDLQSTSNWPHWREKPLPFVPLLVARNWPVSPETSPLSITRLPLSFPS
jgi:hypothetical protein